MVDCITSKHHCDDMVLGIIICAYNVKIKSCTVKNILYFWIHCEELRHTYTKKQMNCE